MVKQILVEALARKDSRLVVNVYIYGTIMDVAAKSGNWKLAVNMLTYMRRIGGVVPNEVCYGSAINACGNGRQWGRALLLFREMKAAGIVPGVITYSSAIKACGGQWEQALLLFRCQS